MKTNDFAFRFEGQHAEDGAKALQQLLAKEFPDARSRIERSESPAKATQTRADATTIAVIALIFSAPGAAKNAIELADRLKLEEKLARLIAWAKERRARRQPIPTVTVPPHALKVPLDQAKPEQLLDAVAGPENARKP